MATPSVDPYKIPKRMNRHQLEYWILFGIAVANKSAKQTEVKMKALMSDLWADLSPFERVRWAVDTGALGDLLRKNLFGQYKRIERAFKEAIELDLDNISVEALEAVHGIGPKTARMIMLYYEPNIEVVPLDTHVLKHLRKLGYEGVPKSTPSAGKTYEKWEKIFIEEAKKAKMSVREFDTYVWQSYAKQ